MISANLNDLPTDLIWVGDKDEVPVDAQSGSIANEGVMITLGNLHPAGQWLSPCLQQHLYRTPGCWGTDLYRQAG